MQDFKPCQVVVQTDIVFLMQARPLQPKRCFSKPGDKSLRHHVIPAQVLASLPSIETHPLQNWVQMCNQLWYSIHCQ